MPLYDRRHPSFVLMRVLDEDGEHHPLCVAVDTDEGWIEEVVPQSGTERRGPDGKLWSFLALEGPDGEPLRVRRPGKYTVQLPPGAPGA